MSLFSSIGKIAGKALRTVSGVVPGPIGAVTKVIGSKLGTKTARAVIKGTALAGAGALAVGGASSMFGGPGRGAGSGMHGGGGRRYRRINPGNTRAMRRSIRRIEAGAKLYSKFFSIKHGHIKHAPHVRLKHTRRRAA